MPAREFQTTSATTIIETLPDGRQIRNEYDQFMLLPGVLELFLDSVSISVEKTLRNQEIIQRAKEGNIKGQPNDA